MIAIRGFFFDENQSFRFSSSQFQPFKTRFGSVWFGSAHLEFSSVSVRFGFSKTRTDLNTDQEIE